MSDNKPIWLLDVDGVLNAFHDSGPVLGDWGDWQTFTSNGFPIRYSPAMTAHIRGLHERGTVEVRWLTTWGAMANTHLKEFGLPEFEVAAEAPFRERDGWWKLPVAQALFDQGHAIIWTDDAMKWMNDVANSDRSGDLYAFAPQGAISQQEMDDILIWAVNRG